MIFLKEISQKTCNLNISNLKLDLEGLKIRFVTLSRRNFHFSPKISFQAPKFGARWYARRCARAQNIFMIVQSDHFRCLLHLQSLKSDVWVLRSKSIFGPSDFGHFAYKPFRQPYRSLQGPYEKGDFRHFRDFYMSTNYTVKS